MATKVKVDFFQLEVPKGCPPFESMIATVARAKNDRTRNVPARGCQVRMQEYHKGNEIVEFEMLKIQLTDLPPKADIDGHVNDLGLRSDEGIGGETAFLYYPGKRVIAVQRNRAGVSVSMMAEYFKEKSNCPMGIKLEPVIQPDALKRLARFKETRKLAVTFAGVTNPAFFRGTDGGVNEMLDVIEFFKAPSASFVMSMGHQSGSLVLGRVKSLVSGLYNAATGDGGDVRTLQVSGVTDDDRKDSFDVLAYRMTDVVDVKDNQRRRITYELVRPHVKSVWERRRAELDTMFEA